jgi:hypothetical protein
MNLGLKLSQIGQEVPGDSIGDEFKGYIFKITGGNDKQGFPMKNVFTRTSLENSLSNVVSRVFSIPPVYVSSFPRVTLVIVPDVPVSASVNLFVAVLLDLILPFFLSSLSNKGNLIFLVSPISLTPNVLDQSEPAKFANSST